MTGPTTPARRSGRVALTVSVALNLFLAGALAGVWLGGDGALPWSARETGGEAVEYSLAAFVRDLPDAARGRMAEALDTRRGDVTRHIEALVRARAQVAEALTAEPYDPEAVRRAFGLLRDSTRAVQATMQGIVSEVTAGLDPADRARLARGMFAVVPPGREDRITLYEIPLL